MDVGVQKTSTRHIIIGDIYGCVESVRTFLDKTGVNTDVKNTDKGQEMSLKYSGRQYL